MQNASFAQDDNGILIDMCKVLVGAGVREARCVCIFILPNMPDVRAHLRAIQMMRLQS